MLIDHAGAYRFACRDDGAAYTSERSSPIESGEGSLLRLPAFAWGMHCWVAARSASRAASNIASFKACIVEGREDGSLSDGVVRRVGT